MGRDHLRVSLRRAEISAALLLLAFSVGVLVLASQMPAGTMTAPGPALVPTGLGTALLLVSIGLLVRALRLPPAGRPAVAVGEASQEEPRAASEPDSIRLGHRLVWLSLAALVILALLLERLGYLLSTSLFMLALLRAYSSLTWVRAIAASIVAATVSWFFFARLLGVSLPAALPGAA